MYLLHIYVYIFVFKYMYLSPTTGWPKTSSNWSGKENLAMF